MEKKSIKSCLDTNSEPGTEDNIVVNCTDLKSGPGTEDDVVVEGSSGGPYLIEKIVGVYMAKDRKKYYRIKWIDSWEPEENLSEACQSLIIDFWNGTTLDQRGAVVKKDELKEGLRIIKKESFFSSSEGAADVTAEINSSGKNNQELDCTNPTKDLNIDSTFCLNDKRIIANQDKDNQELDGANPTKDLNIDSTIRLNDKKVIANQDKNNQELDCANPTKDINKDSTIRLNDKKIVANQDKNGYFASTPKVCCKDHSTLTDKSNAEISIQSNKQISKPGEGLESRDSVLIDSYGKMYSSPPPLITDDECDQQEEVMESNELQFGPTAKNGNIDTLSKDTDSLSVLHDIETEVSSNLSQNAIQVEESNEDDLEITVSIESPTTTNKLKRGRRSVRQLKKLPIVAHSTNNTHLNNALRTQSNIVPTHPRCQLRHASADDSAIVLSPAKRRRRRAASTNPVSEASCNHTLPRRTLFSTQDEVYCDSNSPLGLSNTGQHPLCGQVSSCPQYKDTNFQTGQSKSVEGSPTSALKDRICKICNERFSNITLVRQHVRQKHTSLKSPAPASPIAVTLLDVSLYPCEVCEGLFRSTPDLKSHIQLHKRHNTLTLS